MTEPVATGTIADTGKDARMAWRFAIAFGVAAVLLGIYLSQIGTEWRDAIKTMQAKGRVLRAIHYGQWGVWWGCAIDAVLCGLLAVTSFWWAGAPGTRRGAAQQMPRLRRGAWLGLLAILAVGGAIRWERAGLSFYNDEAQAFRRFVGGQHLPQPDGTVKWHEPPWWETTWLNKAANNSMVYSLMARASFDAWGRMTGSPPDAVSERAVRLPVVLAGTAGLLILWLVMRRMLPGGSACWWVMVLAALHPWHVRYSSEARGHGLLLLGVPLCFWFLQRALEDGRWRWWLGMGVAQFFCVWSFQGIAAWLVVFNGLLLAALAWRAWHGGMRWMALSRPVVGMMLGGMITLPVMLPLMRQLAEAIPVLDALKGPMGLDWWQDVASLLLAGIAWVDRDPGNVHNLALSRLAASFPWIWILLGCVLVAAIGGVRRMGRCGILGLLAAIAGPLAALGMWVSLSRKDVFMYPWYLIFVLPGFLIVWAGGIAYLASRVRSGAASNALLTVLILPLFGMARLDFHLIHVPKEDLRGLAQAIPMDALHGSLFSDVDVYDGDVIVLKDMSGLDRLIADARAQSRPLYVSFSRRGRDASMDPFYARLESGGEFEHVKDFPGQQDPQFTHHLHRLRAAKSE